MSNPLPVSFDVEWRARATRGLGFVKPLLLLPHALILVGILWPLQLIASILAAGYILVTGRQLPALHSFSTGCMRWFTNVLSYLGSLTDDYPPFSGRERQYSVQFDIAYTEEMSRGAAALKLLAWIFSPTFLFVVLAAWVTPWVIGSFGILVLGRYPRRSRIVVMGGIYGYLQFYCMLTHLTDQWDPRTWRWTRDEWAREPRVDEMTRRAKGDDIEQASSTDQFSHEINAAVRRPSELRTYVDIGGMETLKQEMRDTIGMMLAYPEIAARYRVRWNGILLHGPTGSGKSLMAEATAGEFAMNLLCVSAGEIASSYRGRSAERIVEAFETARQNLPCVLFFDEFDSIALRRSATAQSDDRQTVSQLLRSIEAYRGLPDLIVMAATNDPDRLDEAVTRPGRFDRRIRIDYPDHASREAILRALLVNRPVSSLDVASIAADTDGQSPAALREIVDAAALEAMRSEAAGRGSAISQTMLVRAIAHRGGSDRPRASELTWDDLIIGERTKAELIQFQRFLSEPELARSYGVTPPSGLLLHGPPGTGKTTIAKILAAQASTSFYSISASDLMSKWVGETEENISQLFRRARENRPSVVFLDEIDALFPRRGVVGSFDDRWTDQLLQEIDGFNGRSGVFVIGATNRPDLLDTALLRGGRLSRKILIPLPGHRERELLLELVTRTMRLEGVDIKQLAGLTDGFSGADLRALAEDAAIKASIRQLPGAHTHGSVGQCDFEESLQDFKCERMAS